MAFPSPISLMQYDEPDAADPVRVCPCELQTSDDGERVRCPLYGVIPQWDVVLRGEIVFPALPNKRRSHRHGRVLARVGTRVAKRQAKARAK